eukprot:SM000144S00700  [mRNA]  locus=s144:214831:217056:- [translate_table: standard]
MTMISMAAAALLLAGTAAYVAAVSLAEPSVLQLVTDAHVRRSKAAPVNFASSNLRRLGQMRMSSAEAAAPETSDGFRYASIQAPPAWDWRQATPCVLTTVKSQEVGCANCWAVVAADAIASARAVAEVQEVDDLSPQDVQLCQGADCCSGGWPELALEIATNGNLTSHLVAWELTPAGNALALMQAVSVQPVIAYVSSSSGLLTSYSGGLLSCKPGNREVDHAVLVVGYATDIPEPYWLIKNSWGPLWGEGGYAKLAMSARDGSCGMLSMPALMPIYLPKGGSCTGAVNPCGAGTCIALVSHKAYTCNCPQKHVLDASNTKAPKCVPAQVKVQEPDSSAVASPANIMASNVRVPSVVGMILQVPCRQVIGRYCGCTPDTPVCGWTSKLYSSLCDAICNYDTPTRKPDAHGQCDPCQAACEGRCFGNMRIPYPAYCDDVNYYTPCPYPPFPPITSSCTDYLNECQSCCWGLGYGSYAFNQCFSDCRRGKC